MSQTTLPLSKVCFLKCYTAVELLQQTSLHFNNDHIHSLAVTLFERWLNL
jgi:hypothetical protein